MGRGSSKIGGGGGFIRFGDIPQGGKSLNFLKLSYEQRQDVMDQIEDGKTAEEAVNFLKNNLNSWKNVDTSAIFETGVSVFKKDSDGLPMLENLQQAQSMANRIGSKVYSVSGKSIGTGQDGEPVLAKAKGKAVSISDTKMQDKIIDTLKKNFSVVEGSKNTSGNPNQIYTFTDWKTGAKEVEYMGITFRHPKSKKWE